jgi:hypothetical protein
MPVSITYLCSCGEKRSVDAVKDNNIRASTFSSGGVIEIRRATRLSVRDTSQAPCSIRLLNNGRCMNLGVLLDVLDLWMLTRVHSMKVTILRGLKLEVA